MKKGETDRAVKGKLTDYWQNTKESQKPTGSWQDARGSLLYTLWGQSKPLGSQQDAVGGDSAILAKESVRKP